jgi:hypothetical protein
MKAASLALVLAMSVTFILLALQAEPVTATLGFIFGGLLALAFVVTMVKKPE